MKNLNELRDKAYQCAIAHGWHEESHTDEHWLCLVISELIEAVEADRKGKHSDVAKFKEWQGNSLPLTEETRLRRFKEDFEAYIKGTVEEELADACIRLLDLAGLRNIDLIFADGLIVGGEYQKTNESFTEFIYHLCGLLSSEGENLNNKINYAIAIIICYCNKERNIDLEWHIEQKMKYNELRPYKHGDKVY